MAKNFKINPNDRLASSSSSGTSASVPLAPSVPQVGKEPKLEPKKVGRPKKKKDCKSITVAIPIDTLEKVSVAKVFFGNNLTEYITTLIERDLESNYSKYHTLAENLKI